VLHPSQARDEAVHPLDIVTTDDHKFTEIWDNTSESGAQTIEGYTSNVSFAVYHPLLPILVSGSIKIWHANTYRLANTFNCPLPSTHSSSCCTGRRKRQRSNSMVVLSSSLSSAGPHFTSSMTYHQSSYPRHSANLRNTKRQTIQTTHKQRRPIALKLVSPVVIPVRGDVHIPMEQDAEGLCQTSVST